MYIVIEIQTNANGTVGTLVDTYQSLQQAESKYHSVLSYAATSALPVHSAVILTSDGLLLKNESYSHGEVGV